MNELERILYPNQFRGLGSSSLTTEQVDERISAITNSASSVADKVLQFQQLKSQTEASIQNYKLALDNNTTTLSIKELEYQIKELEYQQSLIDNQLAMLQSNNSTTNVKYIVGGLALVAVVGIVGFTMYQSKKK